MNFNSSLELGPIPTDSGVRGEHGYALVGYLFSLHLILGEHLAIINRADHLIWCVLDHWIWSQGDPDLYFCCI